MRINLKTLVLTSAAFCATAAFAANQARVDVPFSFTAKGQSYPAGSYNVSTDANENMITLASRGDTSKQISWIASPAEAAKAPAVVKFDEVGTDHALRSIQVGAHVTPNLDTRNKKGVAATTSISGQ